MNAASERPAAVEAFVRACSLDVEVLKPGNVSLHSAGHGMTAALFLSSAAAAGPALCAPGATIGTRILAAVEATLAVAHCNTNLGIVLLCAPIAGALEAVGVEPAGLREPAAKSRAVVSLRRAVQHVLNELTVADSQQAFRAIALAGPAGLGTVDEQDVHRAPTVNLLAAMELAGDRDLIARQYATGFADVFDTGLAAWDAALAGDENAHHHAMQCVFLAFLERFPDSHIAREHGLTAAQAVSREAGDWRIRVAADARAAQPGLTQWDSRLKSAGVNPGTSADLAVATAFVAHLLVSPAGDLSPPAPDSSILRMDGDTVQAEAARRCTVITNVRGAE